MKTILLLSCILLCISHKAYLQNLYVRPFFGGTQQAFSNYYTTVDEKIIISFDTVRYTDTYNHNRFSLGEGKHIGVAGGRYFKDLSEGLEVSLSYFSGKKQTLSVRYILEFDPYSPYSYSASVSEYHFARTINVSLLYFRQFYFRNVAPFFKTGAVLSYVNPFVDIDVFVLNNFSGLSPGNTGYFYRYKPNKTIVPGGFASAGIELFPRSMFSVTIDVFCNVMFYKPREMKCVRYTKNGQDAFSDLTPSELEFLFVDTYLSTDNENKSKPTQMTRRNHSLSGKGIQMGVKYRL